MLISIRLPALLEEVEGFCQPQVIQGGDSQVMNSYLIPGLRSNTRQVRSSYEACKQELERHHLEKARYRQETGFEREQGVKAGVQQPCGTAKLLTDYSS